jgi:hypothetical protein
MFVASLKLKIKLKSQVWAIEGQGRFGWGSSLFRARHRGSTCSTGRQTALDREGTGKHVGSSLSGK